MKFQRMLQALAALILLPFAQSQQIPPVYSVDFLPGIQGATDINNLGQVIGTSTGPNAELRGWTWVSQQSVQWLPLPPGRISSAVSAINDLGFIVGAVSSNSFPEPAFGAVAAMWTPNGSGGYTVQELGKLPGDVGSQALGLNNLGDVVGTSNGSQFRKGVLFLPGSGILDLSPTGAFDPSDVNDARQVACYQTHASRLDLDTMILEDLGVPPGSYTNTIAWNINAVGQVAGYVVLATSTSCHWKAARYTDGIGWEVYGACGTSNAASSINLHGDFTYFQTTSGFVHLEGVGDAPIFSLIDPSGGPWLPATLSNGLMNDRRQIAIRGQNSTTGQFGILVLTPTWDLGTAFCANGFVNSTGGIATLSGFPISDGALVHLELDGGPPGEIGYILVGTGLAAVPSVPLGNGLLCLGTTGGLQIARYNVGTGVRQSAGKFNANRVLEALLAPHGSGFDVPLQTGLSTHPNITAGSTLHFQAWFRDTPQGIGQSNASTGLSLTF